MKNQLFSFAIVFCALSGNIVAAERPDVLMIAIDDLRPMLGCYGDPNIQTPNIDRLAKRGVVFERAYCQYAKCGTSRLSLMTGLRPDSVGVFSNNEKDVIAFRKRQSNAVSIPRWLKQHGYHAQSFGKIYHDGWDAVEDWSVPSSPGRPREMWEVADARDVTKPTVIAERWDCPVMQRPDVADDHLFAGRMTKQVLQTMRNRNSDKPTFLAVGYRRPHLPFIAPKCYYDLYQPDSSWLAKTALPNVNSPVMAWFNSDGYVGGAKRVGLTMPTFPNREQAIAWNGYEMRSYTGVPNHGELSTKLQLELLQAYAACITYVDTQVGKLLDELDKTEAWDNTIVVLWSDHGWHLGEQSTWGKMTNFEIATRVPFIIAAPSIEPGRTETIAELVDLYPTLCDLTKIDSPLHLQGESVVASLKDPAGKRDSIALSQYSRFRDEYMGRALRTTRYRFVIWEQVQSSRVVRRELYDHQIDPNETSNISIDPKNVDLVKQLERQLRKAFASARN
jgi:iduronate 2-sulfatase